MQVLVSQSQSLRSYTKEFLTAASSGNKNKVIKLLEIVNVNATDNKDNTALLLASMSGHKEIVELLQ